MQKVLIVFLLSLLSLQATSQIAERVANEAFLFGLFDANTLPRPVALYQCADDATEVQIFNFVGPFLDLLNKAGISDISKIETQLTAFVDSLPQSFKDCVANNEEIQTLGQKYGLDANTDLPALKKLVIRYVTLHFLQVKGWIKNADTEWNSAQYEKLGRDAAGYGHLVLKSSNLLGLTKTVERTANEAFIAGLFAANSLANPDTLNQCGDDATQANIFNFVGPFLDLLNKAGISDISKIESQVTDFVDSLPQSFKDCVANNQEIQTLGTKYGLDASTDLPALKKSVIRYVTLHFLQVKGWIKTSDAEWNSAQYTKLGGDVAGYGHLVLKSSNLLGLTKTVERTANEAFIAGLFAANSLANPDTLNQCGDDATQANIFNFVGPFLDLLNKAGISDISKIESQVTDFVDSLPQSFKDCVANNQELQTLGTKYGLDASTDLPALKKSVIRYATLHFLQVKGWIKTSDAEWNSAQYTKLGGDVAGYGHLVLKSSNLLGGSKIFVPVQI